MDGFLKDLSPFLSSQFVVIGVIGVILFTTVAIVLRCVTKPCSEPEGRMQRDGGDGEEVAKVLPESSQNGKRKKKKGKKAASPVLVEVSPVAEIVEESPMAGNVVDMLPEQLLLGASGDTPDLFIPVQFDTSEDTESSGDIVKKSGDDSVYDSGLLSGSIYGSALGKEKEEMDEDNSLPVLGNPQGYENVAQAPSLIKSTESVYEALTHEGGAVSAYLGNLSADAGVYADGDALANSTHKSVERTALTVSAPISARLGQLIDWNATFQEILDLPEGNEAQVQVKYERLSSLAHDFVETAQRLGTLIISEAHLPRASKTLLPVSIGGEAGGEKWVTMGILFKFAVDWKHFYGSDARAMKSAGHELKSLMRYYQCEGIRVPLMALIDYRGYRLVAQSILPISRSTIIYGSNDSGKTVHDSSPEFRARMKKAAEQLNIKGHPCGVTKGARQTMLWAPTDIEGHLGSDGRYYVIDLARVFPPTCSDSHVKETFLYELMRPEWVAENPVPLSSDAFSGFSSFRMDSLENREVFESTQRLLSVRVPEFAALLDKAALEPSFSKKAALATLTEQLHRHGINCRYLGRVRSHCKTEAARQVILVEIVARVVKNLLRERLRVLSTKLTVPGEMPYRLCIVSLLNTVLGHPPKESAIFWRELQVEIQVQFRGALAPTEQTPEHLAFLRQELSMYLLLKRLQRLAAVTLSKQSLQELKASPADFRVVLPDIEHVFAQVTHMNIVSYAEGMSLYLASRQEGGNCSRRLFRLAESKFDGAVRSTPDNLSTLNTYADVLRDRAASCEDEDSLGLYSKAFEKYRMARNWAAVAGLGHHLVDGYARHWRCQDEVLRLASACFEAAAESAGSAGELGRRSLGRVMVTRAALRHDAALYAEAGAVFARDTGALGLPLSDSSWLAALSHTELAALAEIVAHSPALTELDTRWLMSAADYATPHLLCVVIANAGRRLTRITLDFSHSLPVLRIFEGETSPVALLPSEDIPNLQSLFDRVLHSDTVFRLAELDLGSLTSLVVSRQSDVSDEAFAALVARCKGVSHLSLEDCAQVGNLTFGAIGASCSKLVHLNLAGTGRSLKESSNVGALVNACGNGLEELVLHHTQWDVRQYCSLIEACCASLKRLDLSHVRGLDEGVIEFMVGARLPLLESLLLRGCSYLGDGELGKLLQQFPELETIGLDNVFDVSDATMSTFFKAGGDGKTTKASWRANKLKRLHLPHCQRVSDRSLSLLKGTFGELESVDVSGCSLSLPLLGEIVQQVCDRLVTLNVADFPAGSKMDELLEALGARRFPTLKRLSIGSNSAWNDGVSDVGLQALARGCPNLTDLSLIRCRQVTDAGLLALARGCLLLAQLDLSYCNFVTSVGVNHLAKSCHDMTDLNLAHCKLLCDIQLAVGMPKLKVLNLHECVHVAEESIVRIVSSVQSLVFIDLVNCRKVTDRTLLSIQGNCMHLVALALGGSNKISDPALREFRTRRPAVAVFLHSNSSMSKVLSSSSLSGVAAVASKQALYKAPKGGGGKRK